MIYCKDKWLRSYLNIVFACFLGTGLLGAFLVSDEFDYERTLIFAVVGVPLMTTFYLLGVYLPQWSRRYLSIYRMMLLGLIVVTGIGVATLLNAMCSSQDWMRTRLSLYERGFSEQTKKGAFGPTYRFRWW